MGVNALVNPKVGGQPTITFLERDSEPHFSLTDTKAMELGLKMWRGCFLIVSKAFHLGRKHFYLKEYLKNPIDIKRMSVEGKAIQMRDKMP